MTQYIVLQWYRGAAGTPGGWRPALEIDAPSGRAACTQHRQALGGDAGWVGLVAVPQRSWDPQEYEATYTVSSRAMDGPNSDGTINLAPPDPPQEEQLFEGASPPVGPLDDAELALGGGVTAGPSVGDSFVLEPTDGDPAASGGNPLQEVPADA